MGNKRKHEQNGKTSMPRDQMPLEGSSDISAPSLSDVLIRFEETIQVKVDTDERIQKLEEVKVNTDERIQKLEELIDVVKEELKKELKDEVKEELKKELKDEVKEDLKKELIDKVKEELKLEIQEEIQKLVEKVENKISKEDFSVLKEDFKKELEEVKKEPDLDIQEETRSQPHQIQGTRFRLEIKSTVNNPAYKGKPIKTSDSEHINSEHIKVVLYDGDNEIASDHRLASAPVELVVVDGQFSQTQTPGFWSKDDFKKMMKPRPGSNPMQVKNGRFQLIRGKYSHNGAVITENSNRKEVMLGVMIMGDREERVLEGVSNIFRVQEAKTEKDRGKRTTDDTAEDLPSGVLDIARPRYTGQSFSHVTNKNGQGQQYGPQTTTRPMYNFFMQNQSEIVGPGPVGPPPVNSLPQQGTTQLENRGNGPVGPRFIDRSHQQYATQQGTTQLKNYGQGQQYSGPLFAMPCHPQIPFSHTTGNGPVVPPTVDGSHQPYPYQQGTAQPENYGQGQQCSAPAMLNTYIMPCHPQIAFSRTTGNGLVGPPTVDGSHQPYPYQQGTAQLENYGNGPGGQVPADHLQQQNTTQQGASELENLGSGLDLDLPAGDVFGFYAP